MRRRRWFVVSLIVAVLALSVTGGAVLAQGSGGQDGDSPLKSFAARVAGILGLEETQVQDALDSE